MIYISDIEDKESISGIYFCKEKGSGTAKTGKEYYSVTLQDRTGQINGKIWDTKASGIGEFGAMDFVDISAQTGEFNGAPQLNIKRIARADPGSYDPAEFFPSTAKDIGTMKAELMELIASVKEPHLNELLMSFFGDAGFLERFSMHSAAKSLHHAFIGGLIEHTLGVANICAAAAGVYGPKVNRDLLVTGAILHDIGKTRELSPFPRNDYTDEGQLLGHIVIGAGMVGNAADKTEGFPEGLKNELLHLIVSHHGTKEHGSPKLPSLAEAYILAFADDMDAKSEAIREAVSSPKQLDENGFSGYIRALDTYVRKTGGIE